jgi:hypothetical protein
MLFLLFNSSQRGITTGKECLLNQSCGIRMMNQNKNVRAEMFYLRRYSVQVKVITAAINTENYSGEHILNALDSLLHQSVIGEVFEYPWHF